MAPWPDGSGTVERQIDIVNSLASQHAAAEMRKKDITHGALYREWRGARSFTVPIYSYPYIKPGHKVSFSLEADLPEHLKRRYAEIEGVWLALQVDTRFDPTDLVSNVQFVDPEGFLP
jgi:hypothetical protein